MTGGEVNKPKNNRGISFIEIMIALIVISVCVIPLMRMYTTAMNETAFIDDYLTAIDLGREEAEKLKNLALSEDQIKKLGSIISPPIYLNGKIWRTARTIDPDKEPLEANIYVFEGDDWGHPFISLATIVNK